MPPAEYISAAALLQVGRKPADLPTRDAFFWIHTTTSGLVITNLFFSSLTSSLATVLYMAKVVLETLVKDIITQL